MEDLRWHWNPFEKCYESHRNSSEGVVTYQIKQKENGWQLMCKVYSTQHCPSGGVALLRGVALLNKEIFSSPEELFEMF
jgi:hypothetical protein